MPKFSIKNRLKSFTHAFRGMGLLLQNEHNAWIHLVLSILAIALGVYLEINRFEWCLVVLCIGSVFAAEIFNTAIEKTANFVQPEQDEAIRDIKDLAAGAVLVTAFAALICGVLIFLPRLLHFNW